MTLWSVVVKLTFYRCRRLINVIIIGLSSAQAKGSAVKLGLFRSLTLFSFVGYCLAGSGLFAASGIPELGKIKRDAEAKGYIFAMSHEEIVAQAKKEGKLRALSGFEPAAFNQMAKAFTQKYPFIDVYVEEFEGSEVAQRFYLELKSGSAKNWDVFQFPPDYYNEYAAYAKKMDILGMAESGVLSIPVKMVDPNKRSVVAPSSTIMSMAYNRSMIAAERAPDKWEDFLRPELKGRKFAVDIRPRGMAALVPGMGEEWVRDYARKLKEQEPIWVRGDTRAITAVAMGEYPLHQLLNYHSCIRATRKDPSKSLVCKIIEPVPVRLSETVAVLEGAAHPYAALLWLEFQASDLGQKIIEASEPRSSVFAPGSGLAELTRGRKLSVVDWKTFHAAPRWIKMVYESFGFPKAQELK